MRRVCGGFPAPPSPPSTGGTHHLPRGSPVRCNHLHRRHACQRRQPGGALDLDEQQLLHAGHAGRSGQSSARTHRRWRRHGACGQQAAARRRPALRPRGQRRAGGAAGRMRSSTGRGRSGHFEAAQRPVCGHRPIQHRRCSCSCDLHHRREDVDGPAFNAFGCCCQCQREGKQRQGPGGAARTQGAVGGGAPAGRPAVVDRAFVYMFVKPRLSIWLLASVTFALRQGRARLGVTVAFASTDLASREPPALHVRRRHQPK
jgi:hypothetical protein